MRSLHRAEPGKAQAAQAPVDLVSAPLRIALLGRWLAWQGDDLA